MQKRYVSLDVLRGLTVALMIIVNNPGSWSRIFPCLRHAAWDGCTPCDLVFPFFLFCVGTSMAFALAKFQRMTGPAVRKVLKRGIMLYLVGLALTAFPFYPSRMNPDLSFWQNWTAWLGELRLVGVLTRIAMCYTLGGILVLWLQKPKKIAVAAGVLSVIYTAGLLLFAGPEGPFSLEGNFARKLDLAILGEKHMYHGYGVPFDPEGLWGVLTGTCTVLIGYLVGLMIRKQAQGQTGQSHMTADLSAKLFCLSALSILTGLILSIWMPISKPLWSVSYVFYTAGWAMFVLAFLMYVIDVRGYEKIFFPFKALGMNALAIFVVSGLVMKCLWRYTDWDYTKVFGTDEYMSLLFAVIYLIPHLLLAIWLYRRKIFIKL